MKGVIFYSGKEVCELIRSKRLFIFTTVFLLVGLMNPAIAKFIPLIMEMEKETFQAMGLTVSEIEVTALDSWLQFSKNIPIAIIIVLIMFSGICTSEYESGSLIPLLTKGLSRSSVIISKFMIMLITWSLGELICFGTTYLYSAYYWDNSVVKDILFANFVTWLFGVFIISCIVFFSSFVSSAGQVILSVGAVYVSFSIIGMFSKAKEYLPNRLIDSASIFKGDLIPSDFITSAVITIGLSIFLVVLAFPITYRRQM